MSTLAPTRSEVQRPTLSVFDAVSIIAGIVIGAGIYEVPSLVAGNARGASDVYLVWLLGGVLSFLGAICIAELATTYPDSGGNYIYLRRAFGDAPAFLFAWARLAVIQTGSVALLGFVFGDYASQVVHLGPYSSSIYAAVAAVVMTALNVRDVKFGKWLQRLLFVGTVAGLLFVIAAGIASEPVRAVQASRSVSHSDFGLMLVFVLLSYGGWSEAAFIAAELRDVRRNMVRALLISMVLITALYVATNWALLRGLGVTGMAGSDAVAAALVRRRFGGGGAVLLSAGVSFAVLSSMHGTIFTGARTAYALGRDFPLLRAIGGWNENGDTPSRALVGQCVIALALIAAGTAARNGFKNMVEFTAPVFWLFFVLTGIALMVLRRKDAHLPRKFLVPGYPLTPLLFCATSGYLLYSSLMYTGFGAAMSVAVLLLGAVIYALARRSPGESNVYRSTE